MSSKIKILNADLIELAVLDAVSSAVRSEKINSDNTLDFSFPIKKAASAFINADSVFELDGDYFDIAYFKKEQQGDGRLMVAVEAEHVSYRLNEPDYNVDYFTRTGSPTVILGYILAGTGFSLGTVEFSSNTTFSLQEPTSRRGLLMQFVAYIGGELEFSGFTISVLEQRGSPTPKALTVGKDVTVISKAVDRRNFDAAGNPIVAYTCGVYKGAALNLGDVVTMDYDALDIDVSLRVVSKTYDPYNPKNVAIEIGNYVNALEDDLYRIETRSLQKGKTYYGVRISPENGFEVVRSDGASEAVFNSDVFAMRAKDEEGSMRDRIYFDVSRKNYIFDGLLSATAIEAVSADIETVISETIITNIFQAQTGIIAELTVDRLDTSSRVRRYLNGDASGVNYIRVYEQYIEFVEAATTGASQQLTNRSGQSLYWIDETRVAMTTDTTDYPVYVYVYDEVVKMRISFDAAAVPKLEMGQGSGMGPDFGKGYIYKGIDGLYIEYKHSGTGESRIIKLTDDGIDLSAFENVEFAENVSVSGMARFWVQPDVPAAAATKDLWIDTDDYSRYDVTAQAGSGVSDISSSEVIVITGDSPTVSLPTAVRGVTRKLYFAGTGTALITGSVNGQSNMFLYPGESAELIGDGTTWRL